MYRTVHSGIFEVFPKLGKGKMELPALANAFGRASYPIVEGLSEVVDGVAHDRAVVFWDWLFGPVSQCKTIRLCQRKYGECRPIRDFIEVRRHSGCLADQRIDMPVGPFDL